MTRKQQAALAAQIRTAAETQGIKHKEVALKAGTSASTLCSALACNGSMSEEKWRLACECVGVDYDAVLAENAGPATEPATQPAEDGQTSEPEQSPREPEVIPVNPAVIFTAAECRIIQAMIEAHLIEDIQKNGADFANLRQVFDIHGKCVLLGEAR